MEQNFIITKINNVILVGKEEYPEKTTVFGNFLPYHELIFHFSGKNKVIFNEKILFTNENSIRFLPKGKTKNYIVHREEHGECIDIFFDTNIPIAQEAFDLSCNNAPQTASLFKKLFSVWVAKNSGYYFECLSLLYQIFAQLQKENYIPNRQYQQIKPAIDYINEHFLNEKISVVFLANLCGISESYLKKLFLKKFGVPPVKYIIQMKMNYACDLLRYGQYSVTQIAEICGYSNVYYFSRQFKETFLITPTEFVMKYQSSK